MRGRRWQNSGVDAWTSGVAVFGGLYLAAIGRYAYLHAHDVRYASGGLGSSLQPATRQAWAVVLVVVGLAMAVLALVS
jgi:hypothetical protein